MTDQRNTRSDLDDLLDDLSPDEADRLRKVWTLVGEEKPSEYRNPVDTEKGLQRLRAAIEQSETTQPSPQFSTEKTEHRNDRRPRTGRADQQSRSWVVASALVVVVLVGALVLYWRQRPITRTAPLGERLAFRLPDGSRVELNSGSTLRYKRQFGEQRSLRLDGEAFFEVKNDSRPFVVRTFNADVRVLGTQFNIRAWADGPARSTLVTVIEGQVALSPRETPGHAAHLTPGETRRLTTGRDTSIAPLDISADEVTAWRRGDLIAKDQPLGRVLEEVERRFAIDLRVNPSSLQKERINIALRQPENGEAVIRDLSQALAMKYRETSTGFVLYK